MTADRSRLELRIDVLGPLALRVHGVPVEVPGARRRALLALLALDAGRTVGAERLADSLWPEEPPANAVQALYNHVSRLRGHLGALSERLQRLGGGYRLHLEPDELDVDAVHRLVRASTAAGTPPATAARLLREALGLWRGPALEEFRAIPALEPVSVSLEELRMRLVDDLTEARLALGDRTVGPDAAAAAAAAPLRERTALLLVRSLAAEGRSAEAMAAANEYRRRAVAETGLDPGPALTQLEQEVARGDLAPAARPAPDDHASSAPTRRGGLRVARPVGPLVGRQHDRAEVLRLLAGYATVTLTGPGGVGKTRLALDVAADRSAAPAPPEEGGEGVVVDLAAVDRADRVCEAVASTLGLRTSGPLGPADIAAAVAGRRLLLVLDNCEHVAAACRDLVEALATVAGIRVLATSRVTLHLPGEYVVRLQPLPVPRQAGDLDALRRQPAVQAFLEHARRRVPAYTLADAEAADLVEVLRRLDGLPLGIELAARQVALMPLRAVRDRLDRALDLATGRSGAADHRQNTLRATIDSTYRLLDPDEQRLLRGLAPFPGGVDLDTVEALAERLEVPGDPLDVLHHLVDASLVVADAAAGRYRLLFTVRGFLLDELRDTGELQQAETHFLDLCVALARAIEEQSAAGRETDADRRLRAELDNLRAAHDLSSARDLDDVRVQITLALADPCLWRDVREVWSWALELAADPRLHDHPDRVRLLGCAAEAARLLGDLDRATDLAEQAFAAAGSAADPTLLDRAWGAWGSAAHFRGDFAGAREAWLRGAEGRPVVAAIHLASAALAAAYAGDREAAQEILERTRAMHARMGTGSHRAYAAYVEGELRSVDDLDEALACYGRAIDQARQTGAFFVEGVARVARASALTRKGDVAGAAEEFRALLVSWQRSGQMTQLWTTARNAAALLAASGRGRTAALLLVCADAQPGAATVSPSIARHSTRSYLPPDSLVTADELAEVEAEVRRAGPAGVLERARDELADLAESDRPDR